MVAFGLALLGLATLATAAPRTDYAPAPTAKPAYGHGGYGYGGDDCEEGNGADTTTFLPPTATNANPSVTAPAVDNGKAYYIYSTVPGYFLQDLNATDASKFDYISTNFGLINRTYDGESARDRGLSQWQRFNRYLTRLNHDAADDTTYKLLFIGRHGEGYHNAAESFYGTPAWNCYWAEANGNSTANWADARLTSNGIAQAGKASALWSKLIAQQHITPPQGFYVSPLTRCLQTAQLTFANVSLPRGHPFRPTIKEYLREGVSIHTCDHRSNKTDIRARFPTYRFEEGFAELDPLWTGVAAESGSAQDYRSKVVLDDIFDADEREVLSFTSHSGETASLLRVLGHRVFGLSTGAVIPVLVKAQLIRKAPAATTTAPYAANPWCTNGPPVTSLSASGCVCSGGVAPTAVQPSLIFTTGNPRK